MKLLPSPARRPLSARPEMRPPRALLRQLQCWQFIVHECFCELDDDPDDLLVLGPGVLLDLISDEGAAGLCHDAALEFVQYCHRRQVLAWPVMLRYPHPKYPQGADWDPGAGNSFHGVAVVRPDGAPLQECWAFDFTAAQFGIEALPYVWPSTPDGYFRSL
jgi:hypothetical protein